ncbi:MAG: hypothetical protein ACT4QG_14595 [Sporichthyaceae bacterium]
MEPAVPTLDELAARVEALEAAQAVHDATVDTIALALARVEVVTRHHTTRFDRVDSRLDAHAELLSAVTVGLDEVKAELAGVGESAAITARTVAAHADTLDMLREWLGRQP